MKESECSEMYQTLTFTKQTGFCSSSVHMRGRAAIYSSSQISKGLALSHAAVVLVKVGFTKKPDF